MKRFDVILLFIFFTLSTSVLFQNCSEMKSVSPNEVGSNATNQTQTQTPPEFLLNRVIALDNKTLSGQSMWSVGGTDIFYYETDYLATYESTLVTISGRNSVAYLAVKSDDCAEEKALSTDESIELSRFYEDYIPVTDEKIPQANETQTLGCAFPRLIMDATTFYSDGSPALDFEIYFASRECTPDNNLYVSDRNSNDPALALADIQSFFRTQIDLVCGL